ncbi:MAG: DUF3854 domain-containing protein, partial [Romboutsia sp.]|nr:DUF3854 domain-containing protein [Romboutsia sp.]
DRITKSKKYSGKSYINVNQNKIQSKPKVEKINLDAQLKSPEFIDMVYDAITELFPLTNEQYLCLKANRALALKRIREDYFNIPKVTKHFIRDLLNYINEKYNVNYIATDLLGVPGFYVENGEVTFVKRSGLGIKMKNAQGQIVGLQVRRYDYIKDNKMVIVEKEGDNAGKYYWIASPGLEKGCSAGSPLDVLYPLNIEDMYNAVIITEGKFKEEMLIQYFNHATISVQGVSSWKNKIYKEIKSISENYIDIKEAYIAYDADMATNVKVYNQCKKMVEHELLPNNISAQMLIWDYRDGKGIDDLIINNKINTIKKVSFCDYVTEYEKFISKMRELYPKSKQELFLKDDGKTFVEDDIIEKYYREIVFNKLMKSHI